MTFFVLWKSTFNRSSLLLVNVGLNSRNYLAYISFIILFLNVICETGIIVSIKAIMTWNAEFNCLLVVYNDSNDWTHFVCLFTWLEITFTNMQYLLMF